MNVPTTMFEGKQMHQVFLLFFLSFILCIPAFGQNAPTYYLVAGSFNSLESAQSGRNKIEADYGRRSELIFPQYGDRNSRYRVSIYRSSSRTEVSSFSNSLKRKGLSPGWILEMKKPAYPNAVMRGSVASQRLSSDAYARNGVETYYIISGSFKTFEQADRDRLAKIDEGFEAEVLEPDVPGGNYKVSVFYSSSRKQTDRYAALLKKRGTPGWIYTAQPGAGSASVSRSDETTAKVVSAPSSSPAASNSAQAHYIIAGSFSTFAQANALVQTLNLKGVNTADILFPETGSGANYRVYLYQSSDRNAAKARNKQYKNQGILMDGWILSK